MGIDVTTEYFDFELVGRLPMVYHLNLSEENRITYPATVICGGGDGCNQRHAAKPSGWTCSVSSSSCDNLSASR